MLYTEGLQLLQKFRIHPQIIGARSVVLSKLHNDVAEFLVTSESDSSPAYELVHGFLC